MALSDIYQKVSLVQIPSGYKSGTLYSVVPNTADGDFTVTGDPEGEATRVNKDGLIENVAADVPRLNYDPSNPQDPHLLLEPQRTNQFTHSEDLSYIDFQTNSTVTTDNIIAPNGSLTADKTTQTSGGYLREAVSVTNGTTYSFSVFLKKGDLRYAILRSLFSQNGVIPANSNCIFDLDSGSVVYTGTDVVSASIEEYTNDWYRCSFVSVASTISSANFIDFYFTSSSSSTQSSGVEGFGYAWGMQLEEGSYPTSYIPNTTSGEVTRTVYTCTDAGNGTIIKSEGGLFVDFTTLNTDDFKRISITDASDSNNSIFIQLTGTSFAIQIVSGGTILYSWDFSITLLDRHKLALRYKDGDSQLYYNGIQQTATPASGTWFTEGLLDTFSFNQGVGFNFYGEINQAMVFNEALSDAELITLTS